MKFLKDIDTKTDLAVVKLLEITRSQKLVLIGCVGGDLLRFDTEEWSVNGRIPTGLNYVSSMQSIPDQKILIGGDRGIKVLDLKSQTVNHVGKSFRGSIYNLSYGNSINSIIAAGGNEILWRISLDSDEACFLDHTNGDLTSILFHPDGNEFAYAESNPMFCSLSFSTSTPEVEKKWEIKFATDAIRDIAFNPDGMSYAVSCDKIRIYSIYDHKHICSFDYNGSLSKEDVWRLLIDIKNKAQIGSRSPEEQWDAVGPHYIESVSMSNMQYSGDGSKLYFGNAQGGLLCVDWALGRVVERIDAHKGAIVGISISPDGSSLVSIGQDKRAMLWMLT